MADDEERGASSRVERSVVTTLRRWITLVLLLALASLWALSGFYTLQPNEAGVLLRFGAFQRTVFEPGPHLHWPSPIETLEKVEYSEVRREKFGYSDVKGARPGDETATFDSAIQTTDNNIVNLSYVVQYKVRDPFTFAYRMAEPERTLRDAAQSAVREVVGRRTVDEVLSSDRPGVQAEALEILQQTIDSYFADAARGAFDIRRVELQVVQAPTAVQAAFDDVVAAQQDDQRLVAVARGDAREITERASAEAREVSEGALAYRDSKILEARGESTRFEALLEEYQRAPEVTRRRLYLETMEVVLPQVEMVIVEPNTVNLMPYFPLGSRRGERPPIPPPPVSQSPPGAAGGSK